MIRLSTYTVRSAKHKGKPLGANPGGGSGGTYWKTVPNIIKLPGGLEDDTNGNGHQPAGIIWSPDATGNELKRVLRLLIKNRHDIKEQ